MEAEPRSEVRTQVWQDQLAEARLLDPRLAHQALEQPFEGAVNIPVAELESRQYELPAKGSRVNVAEVGDATTAAVEWLIANGRVAGRAAASPAPVGEHQALRLWQPNPFLMEVAPQLKVGAAADLGCGCGREAVWLAVNGWKVLATDRLEELFRLGKSLASRYCPDDVQSGITWQHVDLSFALPDITSFDLILNLFYFDRALLTKVAASMKVGASLVIEAFTDTHRRERGKPRGPELVATSGELLGLLPGLEVRHFDEAWHHGRHTAQLWATKRL